MKPYNFFHYSMIFLSACIVLSLVILILLFYRSHKRDKYKFEFITILAIAVWQISMFVSLMAFSKYIFIFDALSYALGALAAAFMLFLSRMLRGQKPISNIFLIFTILLSLLCFFPGIILHPSLPQSPENHIISFGPLSFIYYTFIAVTLSISAINFLKTKKPKFFSASRSLFFSFCTLVVLNCTFNILLPYILRPVLVMSPIFVNSLQAIASGGTSIIFVGFLYTCIAYEYLDVQLSVQKRSVYYFVLISIFLIFATICIFLIKFSVVSSGVVILFVFFYFLFSKFSNELEKILDIYFFFDAFDIHAQDMKEIDKQLRRSSLPELVDSINTECAYANIVPKQAFIALRDQYTLRDIYTKRRISEKDPRMLGMYHLPNSLFFVESLYMVRHQYARNIAKMMHLSHANMLYIFHNKNAITGFMIFHYPLGSNFGDSQHSVLLNIERYINDYLTHREALFAVRNN